MAGRDRLLLNLAVDPVVKGRKKKGKVSFISAMQQLGIESVFDIIGQPKSQFVERLGAICDADGALAYDNAECYAVQIGRLYREHRVSSGHTQHLTQGTGIRSLTPVGPSYQNQFRENWDQFCRVGALAAVDSPVAYLNHLYCLATRDLEEVGQGGRKILLATRRPDIKELVIDQHSTFTPRPMLELVNQVLQAQIKRYLVGKPDHNKSVYEVLASRRHPFIFPYNFPHHQCRLALAGKKPQLGELNYRISPTLPVSEVPANDYGAVQRSSVDAQRLLCGLGPEQQRLLIEPSLFTTYYLSRSQQAQRWDSAGTSYLSPHSKIDVGYLILPGQPAVALVNPLAETLINNHQSDTALTLNFSKAGQSTTLPVQLWLNSSTPSNAGIWRLNHLHPTNAGFTITSTIRVPPALPLPDEPGYSASFTLTIAAGTVAKPVRLAQRSVTWVLDEFFELSTAQLAFFKNNYGLVLGASQGAEPLVNLGVFMAQTELNAEQVEALLSQRTHYPRLSPNCPTTNPQINSQWGIAGNYGACYVNGHGSDRYDSVQPTTTASIIADRNDNAMGLREDSFGSNTFWYLTKTSLNRFDRLQRKIRLQRWTDIPSAELDTLLICAFRSEGEANLTMDLNINTLRVLGVYRYLSQHYSIKPEEFAALLHDLTPFSTGDRVSLFDQVFNTPLLFDTPLRLDQSPFTFINPNAAAQKTLSQLCAGLGLQPITDSLLGLAKQTQEHIGPLKRDLATVSSIYRQARIARLFGLSAQECLDMLHLLGGEAYQRVVCRGTLRNTSVESVSLHGVDSQMDLHMTLFVDPTEHGDTLLLREGSGLSVDSPDFRTTDPQRLFSVGKAAGLMLPDFLRNADGSVLTLDPLHGGGTDLSFKRITRDAWDVLSRGLNRSGSLRVQCGALPGHVLKLVEPTQIQTAGAGPDILDVLMQLDWAVGWLKHNGLKIADLRRFLGLQTGDFLPRESLVDRLGALTESAFEALVTDGQIEALNLPQHDGSLADIDWRTVLLPLLDLEGLVMPLPLELVENTLAQIRACLVEQIDTLQLSPAEQLESVEKLANLLLSAHDRQLRLIEGLAQEMVNLPMDSAQVVVRWAQTSVHALLSALLNSTTGSKAENAKATVSLIIQLRRVLRYSQAALYLRLSTGALRVFLVHPQWLDRASLSLALSFQSFYLLNSYTQWFSSQSQAEEALLGYFITANPAQALLKTKAARSAVNEEANTALAGLLGLRLEEIKVLVQSLPEQRACSMAEVDWLRRCQQMCAATGLAAADLLRATGLHAGSTNADWQAMGEAAMAVSR